MVDAVSYLRIEMISDIKLALATFHVRADGSLATSVEVKWCVKYYVLYYAVYLSARARRGSLYPRVLLSNAYLTYSAFVADCLWLGPSIHWIPNFLMPHVPCWIYMMWMRRYNTSCVKTSFVAYVVRSTPYILGDIIWTTTAWLVAKTVIDGAADEWFIQTVIHRNSCIRCQLKNLHILCDRPT